MNGPVLTCRNCGAALPAGASFCTLCGAAVYNRAGRLSQQQEETEQKQETGQKIQIPGIIPVTPYSRGPVLAPTTDELGDEMARLNLVSAGAGKRLGAKLIDMVLPVILCTVGAIIGIFNLAVTRVNDQAIQVDSTWLLVWFGAGWLLSLIYWVLLWFWEAKTGKTPGNLLLGLRTTEMKGLPAGVLAIFVRNLIITIGFGIAAVGGVLVMISNVWDKNGKRQGWQDKAAHTLVFDIKAGRDPLSTGGIDGPASFAPVELPGMFQVSSPVAGAGRTAAQPAAPSPAASSASSSAAPNSAPPNSAGPNSVPPNSVPPGSVPPGSAGPAEGASAGRQQAPLVISPEAGGPVVASPSNSFAPPSAGQQPQTAAQQPQAAGGPSATGWLPSAELPHPDEEAGETRFRPRPAASSVSLVFDDGRRVELSGIALIGRNPSGYDGEVIDQLISVPDQSRSISKTHLHVQAAPEGAWVTDRQSTNGSAVVGLDGSTERLVPGDAALAVFGATVRFGDRTLVVGKA